MSAKIYCTSSIKSTLDWIFTSKTKKWEFLVNSSCLMFYLDLTGNNFSKNNSMSQALLSTLFGLREKEEQYLN